MEDSFQLDTSRLHSDTKIMFQNMSIVSRNQLRFPIRKAMFTFSVQHPHLIAGIFLPRNQTPTSMLQAQDHSPRFSLILAFSALQAYLPLLRDPCACAFRPYLSPLASADLSSFQHDLPEWHAISTDFLRASKEFTSKPICKTPTLHA